MNSTVLKNVRTLDDNQVRNRNVDPVVYLRQRFAAGIAEQTNMIRAQREGTTFEKKRLKFQIVDGQRVKVEANVRLRRWFEPWNDEIAVGVRYGNRPLPVKDGKSWLVVKNLEEAEALLGTIREAALKGQFDEALRAASKMGKPRKR